MKKDEHISKKVDHTESKPKPAVSSPEACLDIYPEHPQLFQKVDGKHDEPTNLALKSAMETCGTSVDTKPEGTVCCSTALSMVISLERTITGIKASCSSKVRFLREDCCAAEFET